MAIKIETVRIMPRRIKNRISIAFALTAVIPIMLGVTSFANNMDNTRDAKWESVAFVICIILATYGLILMKSIVYGLIDISKTLDEIISEYENKKDDVSESEIVAMDQLIIYMQNQIHNSRQRLDKYRSELISHEQHFKLPPMTPSKVMPQRIEHELQQAENHKYPVNIFAFKFPISEPGEDLAIMPEKLMFFLKNGNLKADGMGLYADRTWVLWKKKQSGVLGQKIAIEINEFFADQPEVVSEYWQHPLQGYEIDEILEAIERFNGSEDA